MQCTKSRKTLGLTNLCLFTHGYDELLSDPDCLKELSLDLSSKNRAITAVCVTVTLLVDLIMNDQVSSLQRKRITANLHWPIQCPAESSCRSLKNFWEKLCYSLPFIATLMLTVI